MIVEYQGNEMEFPDDMPHDEIIKVIESHFGTPRPTHDDLEGAAVRGSDSLDLMDLDETVKPAAVMTIPELVQSIDRIGDRNVFISGGKAYVISPTVNASEAVQSILSGDDSSLLGYPEKGDSDAAVTKDGEIVTDLGRMKEEAEAGNVIWAANGTPETLQGQAERVVDAIYRGKKIKVSVPESRIKEHEEKMTAARQGVARDIVHANRTKR
jgi:hypothetical protein